MAYIHYERTTCQNCPAIIVTCNDNQDRIFFQSNHDTKRGVISYYKWKNEKEYGRQNWFFVHEKLPKFINVGLLEYIERGLQ